jgi:hypothetical protein
MKTKIYLYAISLLILAVRPALCEEMKLEEYRGVVTFQLLPAKVLKINKIIEHPKPGTSYIGEEGILVEVADNPEVMANWTVVDIKYFKYHEPKIIKYEILSMQKEITVKYHAVSIVIDGDLSKYIESDK